MLSRRFDGLNEVSGNCVSVTVSVLHGFIINVKLTHLVMSLLPDMV